LRVSEAAALKVQHEEGKNKRLFAACGKGGKDRYILLSDVCLAVLREYYKAYRPQHPEGWLFTGTYNVMPLLMMSRCWIAASPGLIQYNIVETAKENGLNGVDWFHYGLRFSARCP